MQITLFGASGKVGRQLAEVLLQRGHSVVAFVHSNKNGFKEHKNLQVITGDVHNQGDIERAIKNSLVVVSTLGSWGTKNKDIVSSATKNLIPLMEKAGIKRLVSVTGAAAVSPHEKLTLIQSANRAALGLAAKPILNDADEHLRLLTESTLSWTAVRSPVMSNKDTAAYTLGTKPTVPWATISRHAVVLALLHLIENYTMVKRAPYISAK